MRFMLRFAGVLIILMTNSTVTILQAQDGNSTGHKGNSISLSGDWYGTYQLPSGTTYHMSMTINQNKKNELTGVQYWPEYYNSKSSITGSIQNGTVSLSEKELVQGYNMTMSHQLEVEYLAPDTLIFTSLDEFGNRGGVADLIRSTLLPTATVDKFQHLALVNAEKFGTSTILSEHHGSSLSDLVKMNLTAFSGNQDIANNTIIKGKATKGQLTMDFISYTKSNNKFRYDYNSGDLIMINARNDSVKWSYSGIEDRVYLEEPLLMDDLLSIGFHEVSSNDFPIYTIHNAKLDSLETVRIYLENSDKNWLVFYLDKATNVIVRRESNYGIEYYTNSKEFNGITVGTKLLIIGLEFSETYTLEDVQFGASIPDSVFDIPNRLKPKVEVAPAKDHLYFDKVGEEAFNAGNYQKALEAYDQAITQTGFIEYYLKRGQVNMELDEYYQAISDLTVVLGVEPENSVALNARGLSKYYLNDYSNAVKDLNDAISIDSTMEEAYQNRFLSYFKLKQYEKAALDCKRLVEINPKEGEYHLYYGITLAQLGTYDEAITQYNQALGLNYTEEGIYNFKGVSHYSLSQFDSAAVYFELASKSDTTNTTILNNLANSYFKLQEYKKVKDILLDILAIDSENHGVLNSLGYTLYLMDDYDLSLRYLNQAISLYKNSDSYYNNRAQTYYAMNRYMEAHEDLTTSIDLNSQNADAYYTRGLIKVTMNNRFDACRDFKKAEELGNEEAEAKILENCINSPSVETR